MPRCRLALVVLASLAAACSRGATTAAPPPGDLTVVTQLPAPGATTEPTVDVAVTFAEDLELASVHTDSVVVSDDKGPVPGTTTYDAATKTVRWTPTFGMALGASHTAKLSGNVRDAAGNTLAGDVSWTFAVREGAWSGLEGQFGVTSVAIERSGRTWFVKFDGSITAGTPGAWNNIPKPTVGMPIGVVIDRNDRVTICAVQQFAHGSQAAANNPQRHILETATWDPDKGWQTETLIDELCRHTSTQFYASHFGTPLVTHTRQVGTTSTADSITTSLLRTTTPGSTPATATWRSFAYPRSLLGGAAVDRRGRFFTLADDGSAEVRLVADDGLQRTTVALSRPVPIGTLRQTSVDADDRLLVVQSERDGAGEHQLLARRIRADGTVEPDTVLESSAAPIFAQLATSTNGHALVLATTGPGATGATRYRIHRYDPNAGTWSPLPAMEILAHSREGIVADGSGTFWLALRQPAAAGPGVLNVYRLRPSDPQLQRLLTVPGSDTPSLVVSETGRVALRHGMGLRFYR